MKKALMKLACAGVGAVMLVGTLAGCGSGGTIDGETRVLRMSTGALDGNFNPFFATSQYDSEMMAMTQISMFTSDENGNLVYGEKWPTVALDYTETMYDAPTGGHPTTQGTMDGRTEYEILIKNGIKFSDGVDLTIKDVLFNLYVYLDPAYTGSSTIYSTSIQGLNAYRTQDPEAQDGDLADVDSAYSGPALARIQALIDWSEGGTTLDTDAQADLETVKTLFRQEAESDWTTVYSSYPTSYEEEYTFTAAWQAYLFNEGLVTVQTRTNPNGSVEEIKQNGKYLTSLDAPDGQPNGTPVSQGLADEIAAAATEEKISAYLADADNAGATREDAILALQREAAVGLVYDNYTARTNIKQVLSYWATASTALERFTSEERSKAYEQKKQNGELLVPTISGITTKKVTEFNGKSLGSEHDVLKIVINGVDPKAKWNFSFAVAPMHIYSDEAHTNAADGVTKFGVEMGDSKFFNDVLQAPDKNGCPVGAGTYMASSSSYDGTSNRTRFFSNNVVYFERNPYFETVGSELNNAHIKFLSYRVMTDAQIVSALTNNEIDYGMPNATPANRTKVAGEDFLTNQPYKASGYGYVGINPKYVPNVYIRRAIMKAMDTSLTITNYYGNLASRIWRPMSDTSWAYPDDCTEHPNTEYENIKFDTTPTHSEITALVELAGYHKDTNGKYVNDAGEKLSYTFTIAGESVDHPAYQMFLAAEATLNSLGFDVKVKPDVQALKKMNSGELAVWAAAWTSAIDPDMYQVYHKDSKATSVRNWGYPSILANGGNDYRFEYDIIVNELSPRIEDARQTLNQSEREEYYHECLDLIMELAIELPTYQRNDLAVYNNKVIDADTLVPNPSFNMSPIGKIWEVNYL